MKKTINSAFIQRVVLAVILVFAAFNLFSITVESLKPSGWVNDFAGVIDGANLAKITALTGELQEKTTAEIAVVTIASLEGQDIDDFTNRLFAQWGVGKKGKDNGVMILVAVAEKKIRIETGYGVEGAVPDGAAGAIIREDMLPRFRSGDIGSGILAGTYAIAGRVAAEQNIQLTGTYAPAYSSSRTRKSSAIEKILSFIFMIFMIILFIKNPWLFLLLLSSGRHGGGGGFGGGGFGGFGGGSSGGGGASGGW